ncbi:hypothetical protein GHU05_04975 [Fructobacillus tropaeoli]|uniref:hypothetical protein n=1 Tax=Fructobacillus tropaeoli TaxID=709323 RepID=UPI0014561F2C|nr:hypothetical protein [Fructobacillus tropaeoli]NLS38281.1 hypothetical protein [Fructobacillus tropaeoli]
MTVKGADEFRRAMQLKTMTVPAKVKALIMETTASTQQQAMRLEPVKTGFLRRSNKTEIKESPLWITGTVYANAYNKDFNYGYAQENGTRYIKPKLFMYQAYNAHKEIYKAKLKAVLMNG